MSANILNANLLIEIPKAFPSVRIWRSNRVEAKAIGRGGRIRHISAGIDGQGDLSGIIGPIGVRLEIETKTTDSMRETQKAFRKMIRDAGGCYIVCRTVGECVEELNAFINRGYSGNGGYSDV